MVCLVPECGELGKGVGYEGANSPGSRTTLMHLIFRPWVALATSYVVHRVSILGLRRGPLRGIARGIG